MSLDKAIKHKKEHRKPYYRYCEQVDPSCRPHGGCPWCEQNRKIHTMKEQLRTQQMEEDYLEEDLCV